MRGKSTKVEEASGGNGSADTPLPCIDYRSTWGDAFLVEVSPRERGAFRSLPDVVFMAYFLNPLVAGQCTALSGDVLGRVLPLVAVAAAGRGFSTIAAAAVAGATFLYRFHSVALLVPLALIISRGTDTTVTRHIPSLTEGGIGKALDSSSVHIPSNQGELERNDEGIEQQPSSQKVDANNLDGVAGEADLTKRRSHSSVVSSADPLSVKFDISVFIYLCSSFLTCCIIIVGGCWLGSGRSWGFIRAAIAGQVVCNDLTPNAGLYWYFFAEVFARFRDFFRVLFLSQPYVYVLPVALRLGMFPEATVSGLTGKQGGMRENMESLATYASASR